MTVADLAAPFKGSITDGPFGSNLARQHYRESGPRVVRLQNIGDGEFIDNAAHIAREHFERLRKHEVQAGDLLIASLGEVLPRACIAPAFLGPAIVKADCIRVRLSGDVDPRWVNYALQRPSVRRWAERRRHGMGRPRLGLKGIREIPVPLPSLEEQKRIVEILEEHLSHLDAGEARLRIQLRRLSALRAASIRQALLVDATPVALSELLTTSIGGVWGTEPGASEVDVRVIRVTELKRRGELQVQTAALRSVSQREFSTRSLKPGDLLLEKSGGGPNQPVGRVGLVRELDEASVCANFMQLLRPAQERVQPRWLHLLLNDLHERGGTIAMQKASTNIRNLKASEYVQLPIAVPSLEEQGSRLQQLEPELESYERLERACDASIQRGEGLRRAVLAAAFEGKLTGRHTDTEVIEDMVSGHRKAIR